MTDNLGANDMSSQSDKSESYGDYLKRAAAACEAGDSVLGMHLYLAAYEKAVADPAIPDGMALSGLREAWSLACALKERSMAEYVFEKLEPFLTGEEIARCANTLQDLALDRLEEYGFSREELQDMAAMISQDLIDGEGSIVKVESISLPRVSSGSTDSAFESWTHDEGGCEMHGDDSTSFNEMGATAMGEQGNPNAAASETAHERSRNLGMGVAAADGFNPYDSLNTSSVGKSYHAATNDGSGSYVFTRDLERAAELGSVQSAAERADAADSGVDNHTEAPTAPAGVTEDRAAAIAPANPTQDLVSKTENGEAVSEAIPSMPDTPQVGAGGFNYRTLSGYAETVAIMRDFGIGLQRDSGFRNFIGMMNARHGLDRMPALDTLLFRSPVIEDATRFVDATIGEIGLPVLRMSMEEGMQGMPVLCVTTQGNSRPRMNHAHNRFDGPGILVIDDLDMWAMPSVPEGAEGIAGFMLANMSRGAREAVNLIRSAVEDPDVFVLATATTQGDVDPFFYELLEPISIVEIDLPTESERDEIWRELMNNHPSLRPVNRSNLVRFSAGLSRYDIYMAARAALEEAYKAGLVERMYLPVSPQNIFDKLAACQPLDSDEYRAIEDEVVRVFRHSLDDLEDLLDGSYE